MDNTPTTQKDDFIAEFHKMDLSKLKDKMFIVAVNTGHRNKCKLLASSIHGPYDFCEMVEQVGAMFKEHQHHAKATVLNKDEKQPVMFLDAGTTDYIEANWQEILTEELLESVILEGFTCEAGLVQEEIEQKEEDDSQ